MLKNFALLALTLGGLCAAPMTYSITVNTSSLLGQMGNVDFQYNPGNATAAAGSVTIFLFSGGTLAGMPQTTGAVSGTLPPSITITNASGPPNDYADGIVFGNMLQFLVSFNGPNVTSPSGSATAGSAFGFSLFNNDFSAALLTSDPDGILVSGQVDTKGNITLSSFASPRSAVTIAAVPEPASWTLIALGALAMLTRAVASSRESGSTAQARN
jgi:hypothetical protein